MKQGALPVGTSLSPGALTLNGTFGGQPGYLPFTVEVGDAFGATAAVTPTFWMYPHISIQNVTCGNPNSPGTCTVAVPYSGGTPGQQVTLKVTTWSPGSCGFAAPVACPQPTGFGTSYQPGQVVVTVTYAAGYPFTYGVYVVRITSTDLCAPGVACTAPAKIVVNG